jgi:MSHA biogenesis protein MshJ
MKRRWSQLAARIDALSQRERVLVFAAALAVLGCLGQVAVLKPLQQRQDRLKNQIAGERAGLIETQAAIARKVADAQVDPDLLLRDRLSAVRADSERLDQGLRAMQSGLVPPERIAPLLESILRANGRLKLVSMQTLPVSSLSDLGKDKDDAKPDAAKPGANNPDLLYRHGVELTVRGSYLDMVDYMGALEALPAQLFWGKAQLQVEQYPTVRLTLTLYTLSMDPKWMKL